MTELTRNPKSSEKGKSLRLRSRVHDLSYCPHGGKKEPKQLSNCRLFAATEPNGGKTPNGQVDVAATAETR